MKFVLSRKRKTVMWVWVVLVCVLLVFPPQYRRTYGGGEHCWQGLIFDGYDDWGLESYGPVEVGRLFAELALVTLPCAALFLTLGSKRNKERAARGPSNGSDGTPPE